ncbi:MAG: hypothetical protein AB8F78_17805 [Saprospiraceae bacterium]
MEKTIKDFIKEIVPIVVGILVALYINNWNEERKDQNYIDRISTSLNKELSESNDDITEKLVQQRTLIDSLDFYLSDDKVSIEDVTRKAKGVYIPTIKMHSWKAISNSKIELMEYEKVSTLADIEEQKSLLRLKSEKLLDFIYANFKNTTTEQKEFMKISMGEIISTELSVQKDIEKVLKE